jgi:hypothetical protein
MGIPAILFAMALVEFLGGLLNLYLYLIGGIASGSLWYRLIGVLFGLMLIPGLVEQRYDRLVAGLSAPKEP